MSFRPVIAQPIEWPVTVATPLEHILVIGFLAEEQHRALSESGLSIADIAKVVGHAPGKLTTYRDSETSRDIRDCVRFLAASGWDTTSRDVIPALSEHGILEGYKWTEEHAKALMSSNPSADWIDVAVSMELSLDDMSKLAAESLPIEYLRAMTNG